MSLTIRITTHRGTNGSSKGFNKCSCSLVLSYFWNHINILCFFSFTSLEDQDKNDSRWFLVWLPKFGRVLCNVGMRCWGTCHCLFKFELYLWISGPIPFMYHLLLFPICPCPPSPVHNSAAFTLPIICVLSEDCKKFSRREYSWPQPCVTSCFPRL